MHRRCLQLEWMFDPFSPSLVQDFRLAQLLELSLTGSLGHFIGTVTLLDGGVQLVVYGS